VVKHDTKQFLFVLMGWLLFLMTTKVAHLFERIGKDLFLSQSQVIRPAVNPFVTIWRCQEQLCTSYSFPRAYVAAQSCSGF